MLTFPIFLVGLAAVLIPIAIHLLQLRRYRKVYFSNVAMLDELQSENRRQRNLRDLLVLLARVLAIVFLVLAFCQPVIPHRGANIETGRAAVSVYVDNSYSMAVAGTEGSLLDEARRKAREIVSAYDLDVPLQLLTAQAAGQEFRWLSHDEFLAQLDALEVCPASPMLSTIGRRQNDFLRKAPGATVRHAYIISDFQRTSADLADYPTDSTVLTTFVPIEAASVANIYIDTLLFNSPAFFPGATVQVGVRLRNDGDHPVERQPLRLWVNGRGRAVASVDVAAHGTATATLSFTVERTDGKSTQTASAPQGIQGYVETTDYPVTFDDSMYFALPVTQRVPVLVVGGADGKPTSAENPSLRRLFATDSLTAYRYTPYGQLDYSLLGGSRLVVLDELHTIPSGLAQTLRQQMEEGASLLVIPAANVDVASYNQFLSQLQAPTLGSWSKTRISARSVQQGHDLYRGVFEGRKENTEQTEMPTFTAHWTLQQGGATVVHTIIDLADGSLCLTETPVGEGHLYLLAAPLRAEYTDFVRQALFVPTFYNMALYSQPQPSPYHLLGDDTPIRLYTQMNSSSTHPPHMERMEDGESVEFSTFHSSQSVFIPDLRRIGGQWYMQPHGEIAQAGLYTLQTGSAQTLAFNYCRRESDLACLSAKELGAIPHLNVTPSAGQSLTDYIRQRSQGTPLWPWCIGLVLLCLLAEILLLKVKL